MKITQTKVIGTFRVIQSPPKEDILPPSRVSDLRVALIDIMNRMVLLQWTAPGDDYDHGKAMEYKVYFTDDWRNLQETILDKIPSSTLNTSEIVPKVNGNEEIELFQLPNSSRPIIFYIALKALDKSGNEGKLSNIVQAVMMLEDLFCRNLTKSNYTTNSTETITSNLMKNGKLNDINIYIISGSVLGIIFLIIVINILVWLLCFRKYKKIHKATRMKDRHESSTKISTTGTNINSDENILRSEYENKHIYKEKQSEVFTENRDTVCENTGTDNSLLMYAKVQKKGKNQKSSSLCSQSIESSRTQQTPNHKENDLGFV